MDTLLERINLWNEDKKKYFQKYEYNPYLIAEIGVNHETSIDLAIELIRLAKEGGANCAKFQTYSANKLASKFANSYWDNDQNPIKNQYELFSKYDNFVASDYSKLKDFCDSINIEFMSTPFDSDCLIWLDSLVDYYKISSSDITNKSLIENIAALNKPVIISTGASTLTEIQEAVDWIEKVNKVDIIINHCVLNYPTELKNANLNRINSINDNFPGYLLGYSDHTKPTKNLSVLIEATRKKALILEKHFTSNKNLEGNDHFHSMDSNDIIEFREVLSTLKTMSGSGEFYDGNSEDLSRVNARRSLVLNKHLKSGEIIKSEDLIPKRPGNGIPVKELENIIGKKINKDLVEDSILLYEDLN